MDSKITLDLTEALPLSVSMGDDIITLARDVVVAAVRSPVKDFANCYSGTFSWKGAPCSILVAWNRVIRREACHQHEDYPETVVFRLKSGALHCGLYKITDDMPPDTQWAVGGLGLLDFYDPAGQGFSGDYADVMRRTAHTVLGYKGDVIVLMYVRKKTPEEINELCKRLKLDGAIMMDGGRFAAVNCEAGAINTAFKQACIVQAI